VADRFADGTLVQRAPTALSRRALAGMLVLTPEMSEVLQLSPPGDLIWDLLAEPITVAELVTALSEHFDVPEETVGVQVRPVLDALLDGGALVAIAPG
jgi:hypothetical protein